MLTIDRFLLRQAQRFCDRFQLLTGLTKFWIEKWLVILTTLTQLLTFAIIGGPVLLAFGVWTAFATYRWVSAIEMQERDFRISGILRMRVTDSAGFRLMCLIATLTGCSFMLYFSDGILTQSYIGSAVFFAASVYASAVMPRPPSKSKMREWAEKALTWLNGSLPTPAPAPVRA